MEQQILFIGIIEEDSSRNILDITSKLLLLSDYKIIYEDIGGDIIGFYNGKRILIIFDLDISDLIKMNFNNFCFDIMVHSFTGLNDSTYLNNLFKMSSICILNSDNGDLISIVSSLENVIAITYGFNSKATLTISSYEIDPNIKVNLCLQRDILPIYGEKVEPFEFCIELNSTNEKKIYSLLAGATLNLIIGDSILDYKPHKNIILTSS